MKKTIWTILIVLLLAVAGYFLYQKYGVKDTSKEKEKEVIKIGADFTLTGNLSFWSTELKKGLDLAVSQQDSLKPYLFKIIYEDNEFKADKAVSIYEKLSNVDDVKFIISCFTPIGQAIRPSAEKFKVPLVATVTSAKDFAVTNEWVFRDFPTQTQQGIELSEYVFNKMGLNEGSFLVVDDDYGRDGADIFKSNFEKMGGKIDNGEYFSQSETNIRNQIIKILNKNTQFVLVIGRDQSLAAACKQIRERDKNVKIVGVNAFDADIVWELLGNVGEGIVFTSAYVDYNDKTAKEFRDSYSKMYNENPNYVSVYGYTIGKYLMSVVEKSKSSNQEELRNSLNNLDYNSIRGLLKVDKDRNIISPIGIYKREMGKTIMLEK